MLDVTTNQNINCTGVGASSSSGISSINTNNGFSSLDDDMEPLFDEDWLHEHNLDLLFDLFEEEVERKGLDVPNTNSSTIFGTSPVTSYLFGTSPSLASALDLYDLLYLDNQQQQAASSNQHQQQQTATSTNYTSTIYQQNQQPSLHHATNSPYTQTVFNSAANNQSFNNNHRPANTTTGSARYINNGSNQTSSNHQNNGRNSIADHVTSSISNAMRIKRKLKKGQNQGVSLLVRPLSNDVATAKVTSTSNSIKGTNTNNKSDKTSTKLTNSKRPVVNNTCKGSSNPSRAIDIIASRQNQQNRIAQLHHYHHHVHYITGCSIIREHAYAVRGH